MIKDYLLTLKKQKTILDYGYTEDSRPSSFHHFQNWKSQKLYGEMRYLADSRGDQREDIKNVYPEFKSALVFLFSYAEMKKYLLEHQQNFPDSPKIAAYTLAFDGLDYHLVLKEKLEKIANDLNLKSAKISLDIQPILERDLAYRAGLGFFGKNSMLIHPRYGSYFIIGSLLLDQKLDLSIKSPIKNHCGHCTKCLDACPTKAILNNKTIDASKCLSHYTIEVFKKMPFLDNQKTDHKEIFGCDICQDVCPWNIHNLKSILLPEKLALKTKELMNYFLGNSLEGLLQKINDLSNKGYQNFFSGTSFFRSGKKGLLKNILLVLSFRGNSIDRENNKKSNNH